MASAVWRSIAAAVVAVLVAAGILAFFSGDDGGPGFTEVSSDEHALAPRDAIHRAPAGRAIAIRGYVYDDGEFLQLCNGLQDGDPPTCRGPSLLLRNLDLARLAVVRGEVEGRRVAYTDEPVVLGGTLLGTELSVVEVLADPAAPG